MATQENTGQAKPPKKRRGPDVRVRRTHERLGSALVALMQEKPVDRIKVQEVLQRASVGRSTFYLHFRDTNDLFLAQLERFLEIMSTKLSVQKEESNRVVPVTELFAHVDTQKKLYRSLADSNRLNDFYELAQGYFARGIERRLKESKHLPKLPPRELTARAWASAGSLLTLLRWWLDDGAKEPPQKMDELFHQMLWRGFR